MVVAPLSAGFQSFPLLPTIKLGPSGAGSRVGGLVHTLGPCGSLQQTLLLGWEFLLLPPQSPQLFSLRSLRLYFPALEPWGMRSALLPRCSSWFIYAGMWSLRCSLGWGNVGGFAVMLCVGEGPRGSNGACSTLPDFSHSLHYPQSNWAPLVLTPE